LSAGGEDEGFLPPFARHPAHRDRGGADGKDTQAGLVPEALADGEGIGRRQMGQERRVGEKRGDRDHDVESAMSLNAR
jgi:hypothetical protein